MKKGISERYKVRNDVHLVEICGAYLLISEKEARDECAYVREINDTAAYFWQLLQSEEGYSLEMLIDQAKGYYEVPEEACLSKDLVLFLETMDELHYLTESERTDKGGNLQ